MAWMGRVHWIQWRLSIGGLLFNSNLYIKLTPIHGPLSYQALRDDTSHTRSSS
jgi:hypothetical protein